MIDELAPRAALTVAALLFLSTGLSVLGLFGGDAGRDAAERIALHLARQLDAITGTDGEGVFPSDGAFDLPPTLAGSPYRLEFRSRDVRVIAEDVLAARALHAPVHPFAPDRDTYTTESLAALDEIVLEVPGGGPFVVTRTLVRVDGGRTYLTFVHLP